jgi:hypothetical protein
MNVNVMVWKCWGVKQWSYNNELNTYACFPTGPTSTGHSVLIHRGGCRHVIGVKFIRVRVCVHVDTRTGKADGKDGRSGTACRSVYEIAGSLADVSAKRVAGKTSRYTLPLSTPLFAMIRTGTSLVTSQERQGRVTFGHQVIPYRTSTENDGSSQQTVPLVHLQVRPEVSESIHISTSVVPRRHNVKNGFSAHTMTKRNAAKDFKEAAQAEGFGYAVCYFVSQCPFPDTRIVPVPHQRCNVSR